MSSRACTHPIKIKHDPNPKRCGKCDNCLWLRFIDIRRTSVLGIEHHKPQRLLLVTVTAIPFKSDLQQVRWNMRAGKLKSELTKAIQSTLTARVPGKQLPYASAAGWQDRGSPDFHFVFLLPDDYGLSPQRIRARIRRAIKSAKVVESFELLDTSTGEIETVTMLHKYGRAGTKIAIVETEKDLSESVSTYLAVNDGQTTWETVPAEIRQRLQRVLNAQPDTTAAQRKKLGFGGQGFRVSNNWGSSLKQRREERQRYAVEQQRQADLATDLAVLTKEDPRLEHTKELFTQSRSESRSERNSQREPEAVDTVIDLPTQSDQTRIHEVIRESVSTVLPDLSSDSSSENYLPMKSD